MRFACVRARHGITVRVTGESKDGRFAVSGSKGALLEDSWLWELAR